MKIHFISSTLEGGGAERVLAIIASAFAEKANYNISIITINKGNDKYNLPPSIKRISMDYGKIPNHTIKGIVNLTRFYSDKKNRPDLIISFVTLTNLISILVARLYSIKIIVEEHNSYLRSMERRKFLTDFTRKHLYKRADLLTVLTSFDVAFYKKYGANVVVMPNPCSFPPIQNKVLNRDKTILAVGNLDRYHHKGLDNLLDLVAPILKSNPDWKLKIAGSGDHGFELLQGLSEKNEISEQVIFTGFVSNISELMRASAIFILPSRFEGLPMVLLEAMSQGMACIAYDCKTGPSDIITNNVNGLLIADQNKEEMQSGLNALIHNERLRERLSEAGIESLDNFEVTNILKRYENLINTIIN